MKKRSNNHFTKCFRLVIALSFPILYSAGLCASGPLGTAPAQTILSPDAAELNQFGRVIAVDGDTVVIGSSRGEGNVDDSGAAFVYVRDGDNWTFQQKLVAPDGGLNDRFGNDVSISGDTVLVGASEDDDDGTDSGSAYVFTRSGENWSFQQRLTGSDIGEEHFFGWGVALSGDTAMVSAIGDEGFTGAVYVFTRAGDAWTQQDKLVAGDGAAVDQLGVALAMDADTLIASALFADGVEANTGAVYVFERSGADWVFEDKFFAPDGAEDDWFGFSVSLAGDTAIVGAPFDNHGGLNSPGGVYPFAKSGSSWNAGSKLIASDPDEADRFGWSVTHVANLALVGANGVDTPDLSSGAVYAFNRLQAQWVEQQKLLPTGDHNLGEFGYAVAIAGDDALVSDIGDDSQGADTGAAFVHDAVTDYLSGDGFENGTP